MNLLFVFFKVFSLLILLFSLIILFFIYPTNLLYNNEKIQPKGETNQLLIGSFILVMIINVLLYLYYHANTGYLCSISSYYDCINSNGTFVIYILLFIQSFTFALFNVFFINKVKEVIDTKKLDLYIFLFSSASILLALVNYKIYENIYSNASLIYNISMLLVIMVTFEPVYLFLLINVILKPKKQIKKKKRKSIKKNNK